MKSISPFFLLFVYLLFSLFNEISGKAIATPRRGNRIIGGQEAFSGQFPFVVALTVQTSDSKFFCGGAIYNNLWVLTSGNCVYNAVLFTIQLGSHTLEGDDPNRQTVATSEYVVHPDFNPDTIENDLGLIKFRMAIVFTQYIQQSYLPQQDFRSGEWADSIGWGQISETDAQLSNSLRFVTITAMSNEECRGVYGNQITDNMLCAAGNYNEGTCIGDTGSPLNQFWYRYNLIVGIASFVSGNGCESVDPSGYTRVYPYNNWIRNVTA